jgi:hypothetical protein
MKKKMVNNLDLIYVNIKFFQPSDTRPSIANFNTTRSDGILDRCSDYKLSICRWNIPSNFPNLLLPSDIELQQLYNVALTWKTTTIVRPIEFIDLYPGTYYPRAIYYITQYIDLLNIAYEKCHNALKLAEPTYTAIIPPTVNFNPDSSNKISLYAPIEFIDTNTNNAKISIQNSAFILGLQGIPNNATFNVPSLVCEINFNVHLNLTNYYKTALPYPIQEFIIIESEYDSTLALNKLNNLIFETSTIPVVPELVGSEKQLQRRVVTDFFIGGDTPNQQGDIISYTPQGPLRWYNLESDCELRTISITPLVEFSDGQTFPIYIESLQSWGIKLLFQKLDNFEKLGYQMTKSLSMNNEEEFKEELND